jgi:hypothetical protein
MLFMRVTGVLFLLDNRFAITISGRMHSVVPKTRWLDLPDAEVLMLVFVIRLAQTRPWSLLGRRSAI